MELIIPITKKLTNIKIQGKPILDHTIKFAKEKHTKINHIIFIVPETQKEIVTHIQEKYKTPHKIILQKKELGDAHAVLGAKQHIKNKDGLIIQPRFLNIYSTAQNKHKDNDGIIYSQQVDAIKPATILDMQDNLITKDEHKRKKILKYFEYASGLHEDDYEDKKVEEAVGAYYTRNLMDFFETIEKLIIHENKEQIEYQIEEVIQKQIDSGQKYITEHIKKSFNTNKKNELIEANKEIQIQLGNNKNIGKENIITGKNYADKKTKIINTIIKGGCNIEEYTQIENSIIHNCIIQEGCIIKNAIISETLLEKNSKIIGTPKMQYLREKQEYIYR